MFTGPNIVKNGLVLWLDAANTKSYPGSGTTWTDLSGNNNSGSLVNGPTFSSTNNGSIVTDGINDYIQSISLSSISITNFTIQVWVYPTNIGGGNGYITVFDTPSRHLSLWIGNNYYGLGTTQGSYGGNYNIQNNIWYCFTIIKQGSSAILIKNNYEITSNLGVGATYTTQLELGSNPSGGGTPMQGRYAIISFYNRALSQAEVQQNYNATKARFGL